MTIPKMKMKQISKQEKEKIKNKDEEKQINIPIKKSDDNKYQKVKGDRETFFESIMS